MLAASISIAMSSGVGFQRRHEPTESWLGGTGDDTRCQDATAFCDYRLGDKRRLARETRNQVTTTCVTCDSDLIEEYRFCTACGAEQPEKRETQCHRCGTKQLAGSDFCAECGTALAPERARQLLRPPAPGTPLQTPALAAIPAPTGPSVAGTGTNGLAIASFVVSICSPFTMLGIGPLAILPAIVGVILGHVSMSQLKRQPQNGRGFAIAGLIIGYLTIVVCIVVVILLILAISAFNNSVSDWETQ